MSLTLQCIFCGNSLNYEAGDGCYLVNPCGCEESSAKRNKPLLTNLPGIVIQKKRDILADFEIFWEAYPNKAGKKAALKAWLNVKPPLSECLATLKWQKVSQRWTQNDGEYVPHPSTWINAGRWMDSRPGGTKTGSALNDPDIRALIRRPM